MVEKKTPTLPAPRGIFPWTLLLAAVLLLWSGETSLGSGSGERRVEPESDQVGDAARRGGPKSKENGPLLTLPSPGEAVQSPKASPPPQKAGEQKPGEPPAFPLALEREYRYSWVRQRSKVGETRFKLTEVDAPTGSPYKRLYRSSSQYRFERQGVSEMGEHDAYFDRSWKPVRFQSHARFSGLQKFRSRQDQEGEVKEGRLSFTVTDNEDESVAVRRQMEAPPDGYLFLNEAFDQLAILMANLLQRPTTYDAKVIYPGLLKVLEIRFLFEKEETVDLGKGRKPLSRLFSFRSKEGDMVGKVWVDPEGRMLQYEQGDLRIYLEE
jgi:hypothetical protein